MSDEKAINDFFETILGGESRTYNDHNWYVAGNKLKGYIEGVQSTPYPLLKKPLSEYTLAEVKAFQSRGRDNNGQLWATGRYQIIPTTLASMQQKLNIPDTSKYDKETQDKIGLGLLMNRPNVRKYIKGEVADTTQTLQLAALDIAKEWSSVGVPYPLKGSRKNVDKNQSYYSGGGDKASTDTEIVQEKLKALRMNFLDRAQETIKDVSDFAKKNWIPVSIVILGVVGLIYYAVKSKKISAV
jgi:hypothetical protein